MNIDDIAKWRTWSHTYDNACMDGTLEVKVEDATKVGRVLITDDKHRGGLYYPDEDEGDLISRQAAIDMFQNLAYDDWNQGVTTSWADAYQECAEMIRELPPAQPGPLSDAYMKAVWTWLSNYQIKAAELKGRYTPYEVLSWVANDWRKEHERQTNIQ